MVRVIHTAEEKDSHGAGMELSRAQGVAVARAEALLPPGRALSPVRTEPERGPRKSREIISRP